MKLKTVSIFAWLEGPLWQGIEGRMEKRMTFLPINVSTERQWKGLDNALSILTKQGDFEYCGVSQEGIHVITTFQDRNREVVYRKWIRGKLVESHMVPA